MFSYDPSKLGPWRVPRAALDAPLPAKLRRTLEDWIYSGASVSTSLERIHQLDEAAIEKLKLRVLYFRRPSETSLRPSIYQLSAIDEVEYPFTAPPSRASSPSRGQSNSYEGKGRAAMLPPRSTAPKAPAHALLSATDRLDFSKLTLNRAREPIGMESPPFTPVDSHGNNTPRLITTRVFPSNENISLSQTLLQNRSNDRSASLFGAGAPPSTPPLTSRRSSASTSTFDPSTSQPEAHYVATDPENFDAIAWENFMRVHSAERRDLFMKAMPRLRGCTISINSQLKAIATAEMKYGKGEDVDVDAIAPFTDWWCDHAMPRHARFVEMASLVRMPVVDVMPDLNT